MFYCNMFNSFKALGVFLGVLANFGEKFRFVEKLLNYVESIGGKCTGCPKKNVP